MEQMNITSAIYEANNPADSNHKVIRCFIDDELTYVPLDPANRHYAEIMRQVEAGELTIQEADTPSTTSTEEET